MALGQMPQPELIQHRLYPLGDFRRGGLTQLQRISNVLKHRFVRPQGVGLKHQPQVALFGGNFAARAAVVHRAVADDDPPLAWFLQPGHRPQQRGFPLPDGPSSETTSPRFSSIDTPFSTGLSP